MSNEPRKVYFVEITTREYIDGEEYEVPIYWVGKPERCYSSSQKALETAANDKQCVQGLAFKLARKHRLSKPYDTTNCGWRDLAQMNAESREYYRPLLDSLKEFILSDGMTGDEFLTDDVVIHVPYMELYED